jgi:sugar (pentulose or hexulose) kinase
MKPATVTPKRNEGDMAYLIGVDGGTESIRAFVFDLEGRPKGSHASAYQTQFPEPSWAEQNPEDWWRCMGLAVRGAVNAAGIRVKDVLALCVDTTCCSVVSVDSDGKPLRPR